MADDRRMGHKPLFIMRRYTQRWHWPYSKRAAFSGSRTQPPAFHAMLSDHEWIEWSDVLGMVNAPPSGSGPSFVCFRRLHAFQDYNMTMSNSAEMAPYWRRYRESLWTQLRVPFRPECMQPECTHWQHDKVGVSAKLIRRVLFMRRPGTRRALLNHDAIAATMLAHGFEVHSITPDWHSLSIIASAVVQASLLIGINSGAYNAVFLRTGCGVLDLCAHTSELHLERVHTWQVGFEGLGVHEFVYACRDLYPSDYSQIHGSQLDGCSSNLAWCHS
jgi:hypothetical protein